ncbi:hydrogenase formation protein HypD [Haloimpatiens sp. FM7330]|uniref:hydrogenase formation protein HypD n=1 Tax=Haloimpatiens sp. FM7330 TaxID=3298610 RepID=UPI0036256174
MYNSVDFEYAKRVIKKINKYKESVNIMEVCGTHTMAISKYGLRSVLNSNINLISGPGCPVCVTPNIYLDYIYELSLKKDVIIASYGDMIRVPGSKPYITLEKARAQGANIKIVYSSLDALKIAKSNRDKKVVFLGIGFETTTPSCAVAILEAVKNKIDNFYLISLHKLVEPVMKVLLEDESIKIDGFICPGHVGAIIGEEGFQFLKSYKCPGVLTGFQLEEIVNGIYLLIDDIKNKGCKVQNAYSSLVKCKGNVTAKQLINKVFEVRDDYWRGMGLIKNSGLKLKEEYKNHDIEEIYPFNFKEKYTFNGCQCGEILKGKIKPNQCELFGKACTPDNPIGPCMVSSEGSCAAYFKYQSILTSK